MRKTDRRSFLCFVLFSVALAVGGVFCGVNEAAAAWDHSTTGEYETYYWDGAQKFRYDYSGTRWQHYSGFGGWADLSATGLSSTFIGDGNWYNLQNGLHYRYNETSDYGFFTRGGQYRFYYRYAPGQWYTSGFGGGWYTLGASGRSSGVLGDGNVYDLGNGQKFRYHLTNDFGFYYGERQYRFYYQYGTGQWYTTGYGGGWHALSGTGVNAATVTDGTYHALGNGYWYKYLIATDEGYWGLDGSTAGERFHYFHGIGQWAHQGTVGGWIDLGMAGRRASFMGDGAQHDLGDGFLYSYLANEGTWSSGGSQRFRYGYTTGQWDHAGAIGGWVGLGPAGLGATFIGNGDQFDLGNGFLYSYSKMMGQGYWMTGGVARFVYTYGSGDWFHYDYNNAIWRIAAGRTAGFVGTSDPTGVDLGNGFFYRYAGDVGYWLAGGLNRFHYDYASGQWSHYGFGDIAASLSQAGTSGRFVGDGHVVPVNAYCSYWYDQVGGIGYWMQSGVDVFSYDYVNTQWSDYIAGRGWKVLGAVGQAGAYIGDGASHDLGGGFLYTYSAGRGYFFFDAAHHFRQSYTSGAMEFNYNGNQWAAWTGGGSLQALWPTASGTNPTQYIEYGGAIYFITNDGVGPDLYRWNGVAFDDISGGLSFSSFEFLGAVGANLLFKGYGGTSGTGWDAFLWDGITFAELSGNANFGILNYVNAMGSELFFTGYLNPLYRLYRWNGSTFADVSGGTVNFSAVSYYAALDGSLYFGGNGGTTGSGYDLFRWNTTTSTLEELSGNIGFLALYYEATVGGDLFFRGTGGTSGSGYDLFRWNNTALTFNELSGNIGFSTLTYMTTFEGALFYMGTGGTSGTGYDVYRWTQADGFVEQSGNQGFSNVILFTTMGSELFFRGNGGLSGTGWDIFHWDATNGWEEISGNIGFSTLNFLTTLGTELYFNGTGGTSGTGYDLYRWDGTLFEELSGNIGFSAMNYLATIGTELFFNGNAGTSGTGWDIFRYDGTTFGDISGNGDYSYMVYVDVVGTDLYLRGSGGPSGTGYDVFRWNAVDGFDEISGNIGFTTLNYLAKVGTDLYFTGTGGTSGTGYDLYRWNGTTLAFEELSGNIGFTTLTYLTTIGTDLFVKGTGGTSGSGYDLYMVGASGFTELSGNKNYTDVLLFATIGANSYWKTRDASGWDIYGWNGTAFSQLADLNATTISTNYVLFNNDLFFHAQVGTPWWPGLLWLSHYDFLMDRMQ